MEKAQQQAIVIGGGLGGLSAAISLSQSGYDVSLFEQNSHFGGKLNRKEQDGFGFDLGPSILTMPYIFEQLFTASGKDMADYIPITRLDLEWRSFFPDGSKIDLYGDLEKMAQANPHLSEADMQEYREFLDYANQLYDATKAGYFAKGLDTTKELLKDHGVLAALKDFDYFSSMHDGAAKRISNPQLIDMLGYFSKYVGSSPYDAPAVLNMMPAMQQKLGAWYVPGGMHLIAAGMVKLAEEIGVKLHPDSKVVELITDDRGTITAAVFADGSQAEADVFVSNMEVIPAYDDLLGEDQAFLDKLEQKFEPAASGLVLHLGVNKLYPQLAHHNFFFSADPKKNYEQIYHQKQLPADPTIYLVNVSKTDAAQTLPGHENIKILPHIPYLADEPFTMADYLAFRETVLAKLERMGLTGLREHIVTEDMWTPADIQANYSSHRGAIYGTVSDRKKNHGFKHPKTSKIYDNLYFVGGTVNPGGGMPMVTLSGQQVRDRILARKKR